MSLAVRTASWQEPKASDIETRIRVERVLAMARVFFAMVTLLAIYIDPAELSADRSAAQALLIGYVSFSAIITIIARLAPASLLKAGFGVHLVDLLFAASITFLTRGSGSPFFVFFVFALFAAPVRWGMVATLATAATAAVLFLAEAQFRSAFCQSAFQN